MPPKTVLVNTKALEFQMIDGSEPEVAAWGDVEGEELEYQQENSVMMNLAY